MPVWTESNLYLTQILHLTLSPPLFITPSYLLLAILSPPCDSRAWQGYETVQTVQTRIPHLGTRDNCHLTLSLAVPLRNSLYPPFIVFWEAASHFPSRFELISPSALAIMRSTLSTSVLPLAASMISATV
jgi:hypothetical protein